MTFFDDPASGAAPGGKRSAEGADHAGRHRSAQAKGRPNRHDQLTNAQAVRIAECGGVEVVARVNPGDGEI